jgi:hypothetical protein
MSEQAMKCPHCSVTFHFRPHITTGIGEDDNYRWLTMHEACPSCNRSIIKLLGGRKRGKRVPQIELLLYPGLNAKATPSEYTREWEKKNWKMIEKTEKSLAELNVEDAKNLVRFWLLQTLLPHVDPSEMEKMLRSARAFAMEHELRKRR